MVTEHEGIIYGKVWGFIPKDKRDLKSKKENVDYNRLISQGVCFECGDEVIDYGFVEDFLIGNEKKGIDVLEKSIEEKYGVEVIQTGYDRYNALSSVQKLEAAGFECVEIKQHSSILHMPTKLLKELVLSKMFHYDDNLLLEINFQNARCTEDTNLNKYVNKKRSAGKVDMVVATILSMYLLQQDMLFGMSDWGAQVV
jgi:phage terminase large subunit-like protein